MVFLFLTARVGITRFATSSQLHFFAVVDFFRKDKMVSMYQYGGLVTFGGRHTSTQPVSCVHFFTKNEYHGSPLKMSAADD